MVLTVTVLCPQADTLREVVQQHPGASVPTAFGVFPSSSFLKVSRGQVGWGAAVQC